MASSQEFRKVNEILNLTKNSDGCEANLFDILDRAHISLDWWRHHKKWIFYRFPQLSLQKLEGQDYLVYREPEK